MGFLYEFLYAYLIDWASLLTVGGGVRNLLELQIFCTLHMLRIFPHTMLAQGISLAWLGLAWFGLVWLGLV